MNTAASFVTASLIASAALTSGLAFADPAPATKKNQTTHTTAAALPTASPTTADETVADDAASRDEKYLRGLELVLRPSFGGAGSGSPVRYAPTSTAGFRGVDPGSIVGGTASPYGAGFVGQAMVGYRFHPLVSAGVRGGFRNASASTVSDGSTDLARSSWDAGFYARAYPLALAPALRKYVDPWLGVGVEYMRDTQTFKRSLQGTNVDFTLDDHAVAVPLGIGVDYRVLPQLAVGPSFEYTLASSVAGCLKAAVPGNANSFCSNEDPGKQFMKADSYGVWTAGLDVRATF